MSIDWPRFVELVGAHQRYVLTSHVRPDCDALGSELGMAGVLESLGKHVRIVNAQVTPPNLQFIDPERRILALGEDIQADDLADADVLLVLDTSAWAQLGSMGDVLRASTAKKWVMDHHVSEDDLGAESFKDTAAEATGRIVVEAADALGVALTPDIARPLFAAVATDTGWFRFSSTTAGTMNIASRLVAAGAVPAAIYAELYERSTLARVQLIGRTLARTQAELDGRLVHTAILQEDFAATGALPSDTEDLVNMTLAVEGSEVAAILVEQATGGFKISLRSRGRLDCSQIAEMFGGGGHRAAAGAFLEGAFETAQARLLDVLREAMR